tara:strand:- start:76908 stop:77747 length:840 start_codon:yes stop_codon:yes gene_type:complete
MKYWENTAFNQVPHSDNRIHSDELAQAYGFTGALVPGVTVSAYLIHPAVYQWGLDWLTHGSAHVVVKSPLYDETAFAVSIAETDDGYHGELRSGDRLCAVANVMLSAQPDRVQPPPGREGADLMPENYLGPPASREYMETLSRKGCLAKRFVWSAEHEMATYLRDQMAMPALLRTDGPAGSGGYANMSFLLGCANRHFAAVARMSPWIHLETRSWNYQAVPLNTVLISEMRILDLFNKKGHEFADCEFNIFREDDGACVCRIEQRAIYHLRDPAAAAEQ